MTRIFLVALVLITAGLLVGCAGMMPADRNMQKEFTYDFQLPGKTQGDLWRIARDHFAESYGDSRSVFRVVDEKDGTFIGRGLAPWPLAGNVCTTEYHIRFAAKDGKARLQYELIDGVPALSPCTGWPWPSKDGYRQITDAFANNAKTLELVLQGKSAKSKLKDF